MEAEIIRDLPSVERLWSSWDELAVQSARPYGAPAWQLGWWRAAAPAGARPVVLIARDGSEPVGILALWAQRTRSGVERLRIMGAEFAQGTAPVVRPGQEPRVFRCFATALAELRPRPATLELDGVPGGGQFVHLLTESWPGRSKPRWQFEKQVIAPVATLAPGTLDDWLATRSSGFRQQMRRSRRELVQAGASFTRATTTSAIEAALPELLRLHHERWAHRGGSRVVNDRCGPAMAEVARRLGGPDGRMHVELIELDGATISAHLFLAAGVETTYWLGGFDDAYSRQRPGLVALLGAVGHALQRGATRLDLGPGRPPYKLRFADGESRLDWGRLLLPGPQRPFTRLQLAPGKLVRGARGAARRAG